MLRCDPRTRLLPEEGTSPAEEVGKCKGDELPTAEAGVVSLDDSPNASPGSFVRKPVDSRAAPFRIAEALGVGAAEEVGKWRGEDDLALGVDILSLVSYQVDAKEEEEGYDNPDE